MVEAVEFSERIRQLVGRKDDIEDVLTGGVPTSEMERLPLTTSARDGVPTNERERLAARSHGFDRRRQRPSVAVTGIDLGQFGDSRGVDTNDWPAIFGDLVRSKQRDPRFPLTSREVFDESTGQPIRLVPRFAHILDVVKLLHPSEPRSSRAGVTGGGVSQVEMEAERVVESLHDVERDAAQQGPDAFDSYRADLFSLCLGVDVESGLVRREQRLEWVDVADVGRDWDDRHDAAPESLRRRIGSVVADNHARARMCSFAPDDRVKIDETNLTATHQASAAKTSQAALSGSSDHSAKAAAYESLSSDARSRRIARCSAADRDGTPWVST